METEHDPYVVPPRPFVPASINCLPSAPFHSMEPVLDRPPMPMFSAPPEMSGLMLDYRKESQRVCL